MITGYYGRLRCRDIITTVSPNKAKTLYITSHDRHIRLSPAPDLEYDLRAVPNLPHRSRQTHTGLSTPIREGLLDEPTFRALLD
ncbi:hypothetical protein MGN70_011794 [Eutypa lata]|nr:hypothetical protein MGN70_011794 [Eutypa lata]